MGFHAHVFEGVKLQFFYIWCNKLNFFDTAVFNLGFKENLKFFWIKGWFIMRQV